MSPGFDCPHPRQSTENNRKYREQASQKIRFICKIEKHVFMLELELNE